jgi:hypothetical protein
MPISSSDAAQVEPQTCAAVESTARYVKGEPSTSLGAVRHSERGRATAAQGANALYSYPWLIERISQTFFQEWDGA